MVGLKPRLHVGTIDEIFAGQWRLKQSRPDSFAEQQMKLTKLAIEDLLDTGTKLVEVLQGTCPGEKTK